jgi:hypothetical protein
MAGSSEPAKGKNILSDDQVKKKTQMAENQRYE